MQNWMESKRDSERRSEGKSAEIEYVKTLTREKEEERKERRGLYPIRDKSITSVEGRHFVSKYLIHVIQRWSRRSDIILLNATGMSYPTDGRKKKKNNKEQLDIVSQMAY